MTDLVERRFLLVKRGLYYGPNNSGYTGFKERAGRYFENEADEMSGVTAIHEDDADEIAPKCFDDLARDWLNEKLSALRTENEALRKRVAEVEEHIRGQSEYCQTRIQDGIELGATVWRLALEDIVRENVEFLSQPNGGSNADA